MSDIREYYKSYYARMADKAYTGEGAAHTSRMLQVREWLKKHVKPGGTVLDIGVGDGIYAVQNPEYTWHGMDINIEKLANKPVIGVEHDLEVNPYPYPNQHFDAIITSEVLEHLFTPGKVHQEARRMLKRDGVYIVTTPQHTWVQNLLQHFDNLVYDEDMSWRKEHIRTYTYDAHKKLLNRYGFAVEEWTGIDGHFCGVVNPMAEAVVKNAADAGITLNVYEVHRWMGQGVPQLHHTIGLVCKKV